uniref:Secreted protein n=1 Tax=Arion vulgaris TaxID=1028688 RepID=A0A0B7ATN1_9EUPU
MLIMNLKHAQIILVFTLLYHNTAKTIHGNVCEVINAMMINSMNATLCSTHFLQNKSKLGSRDPQKNVSCVLTNLKFLLLHKEVMQSCC